MHMKKLEIRGFKSFADKLNLVFDDGITAIVGPNGSGKSNVADAIRWVLGEQSVKTLRGAKMEDVIFAGTQTRKPVSFAGVSITFDNSSNLFPIDYEEVKITRRVYRSGESEYYINNKKCRLKDIHEMLMDTGIGKDGYSIIGQGQVEQIISTKPDDRRNMFEEAVGIVKYKTRKHQAEKKLDEEKQNLLRVNDIILEIEGQLGPLERQAEKTQKYISLTEDLKRYEMNQFIMEHETIKEKMSDMDREINLLMEQIEASKAEQAKAKDQNAASLRELEATEQSIEVARSAITDYKTEMEKLEGCLKLSEERISNIQKDDARLDQLVVDSEAKKAEKNKLNEEKNQELTAVETELNNYSTRLSELTERLQQIDEKIKDAQVLLDAKKSSSDQILQVAMDKKTVLQREEILIEQLEETVKSQLEEASAFEGQLEEHRRVGEELNNKKSIYQKTLQEYEKEMAQYQQNSDEKKEELDQLNDKYQKAFNQLNMSRSRLKFLEDLNNDYEGFNKSVKNVLKLRDQHPSKWNKIHGVVSELIEVPKNLELAIEIALGNSIQNVVSEDEIVAKAAIEHLKSNKLGRATFLPLNMLKDRRVDRQQVERLKDQDIIGFADQLIGFDSKYSRVFSRLLGNVLIVKNFNCGSKLAKQFGQFLRIVTLEGEQFNIGGSITGGSYYKKNSSILSRNREITELKDKIGREQKKILQLQEALSDLKKAIEYNNQQYELFTSSVMTCRSQLGDATRKLEQVDYLKNYVLGKLKTVSADIDQKLKSKEEKENNVIFLRQDIKEMDASNQSVLDEMKAIEDSVKAQLEGKADLNDKLTEVRIAFNEQKQLKENILSNIRWINRDIKELDQVILQSQQQKEENAKSITVIEEEIAKNHGAIETSKIALSDTNRKMLELEDAKQEVIKKREAFTSQVEASLEKSKLLNKELGRFESQKARYEVQLDSLRDRIWDEYQLTYQTCLKYKEDLGSEKDIKDRIYKLRSSIKALGNINMNAIEEYAATSERYEFLNSQRQDILLAEEKLQELIDELTKAMEAQFAERFKIIANEFNIVFQKLFGGGKGILRLSNTSNLLEAGIEIIAQPPGKKLQSMTLLSGGEKALTAIALLFAIQKMNPSPFCVLDEIEAALDDSNIVRFSNYLQQLAEKTQYLVITHRKGTMEAANALYGITMQEKGVSKSVSVKFDESDEGIKYA